LLFCYLGRAHEEVFTTERNAQETNGREEEEMKKRLLSVGAAFMTFLLIAGGTPVVAFAGGGDAGRRDGVFRIHLGKDIGASL
jgi:hypothetical protein